MTTVNSVSGGQTSAYIAANYPADYNVFALVRIEDERCRFPDEKIRREVEDRIQAPFIATAEDDLIIYTMLDLEQFLGKKIHWVTGPTFDYIINVQRGGRVVNRMERGCTIFMKLFPIFEFWQKEINVPVEMRIGYRANEANRANSLLARTNANGLSELRGVIGKSKTGNRKKWGVVEWRRPVFPLIRDNIYKNDITNYWNDKEVRFAPLNNCVGCFFRNPLLLRKMWNIQPEKMQWFADQENEKNGTWKTDLSYEKIRLYNPQYELDFSDFSDCDSGFCEVS